MKKYYKIIYIFLLLIINKSFNDGETKVFLKKLIYKRECNFPTLLFLNKLLNLNVDIKNNSILILEPFRYHYECTPGFSKYFIDLGYDVDIVMNNFGITSFCFFEPIEKIRFFLYENLDYFKENIDNFSIIFNKYNYLLIETTEPKEIILFDNLNLLNINHSIFVFHHIDYLNKLPFTKKLTRNQIWSLGKFPFGKQVNPHFFGYLKYKRKNRITKFFMTSTIRRNYELVISTVEKIKSEKFKFRFIVIGKSKTFTKSSIMKQLRNNFSFKYNVTYSELYKEVYDSDYIILNLVPNNIYDTRFTKIRVTGSVQLAYGFLKPVIIHQDFAKIYNFNSSNSFIYDDSNFLSIMKDAINLDNARYQKMKENILLLSKDIYHKSLFNVNNSLNRI